MRPPASFRRAARLTSLNAIAREQQRRKQLEQIPLLHPYIIPGYILAVVGITMVIVGAYLKIHALFIGVLFVPLTCAYCNIMKRCRGDELRRYNEQRINSGRGNRVENGDVGLDSERNSAMPPRDTFDIAFVGDPNVVTRIGDQTVLGEFPKPPPYVKDLPKYSDIQQTIESRLECPRYAIADLFTVSSERGRENITEDSRTTISTGIAPWAGELEGEALPTVYANDDYGPPPSYQESTETQITTTRY